MVRPISFHPSPRVRLAIAAALLLATAGLLSCSRSRETTTTESGGVAQQHGAGGSRGSANTAGIRIARIVLGREMTADRRVIATGNESFTPGDTVFASVVLAAPVPAAQLVGRWKAADGTVVYESTQALLPSQDEAAVIFHLVKPAGLTPGTYTLEVLADGRVVGTKEVTVVAPH